jgi:hypothetical protein
MDAVWERTWQTTESSFEGWGGCTNGMYCKDPGKDR